MEYGKLTIGQIETSLKAGKLGSEVKVMLNSKLIDSTFKNVENKIVILFDTIELTPNKVFTIDIKV